MANRIKPTRRQMEQHHLINLFDYTEPVSKGLDDAREFLWDLGCCESVEEARKMVAEVLEGYGNIPGKLKAKAFFALGVAMVMADADINILPTKK